jgi:hypothetical protein
MRVGGPVPNAAQINSPMDSHIKVSETPSGGGAAAAGPPDNYFKSLVPGAGLEPARGEPRGILSPLRLPVPPPRLMSYFNKIAS